MEATTLNPLDVELDKFEQEIRRLKIEYDIYFNGGTLRPPLDTKGRVETTIKRLFDARGMSFGQRFRYNSLVARYNVMRELWRRHTQEREVIGRPPTAEAQSALREHIKVVRCSDPKSEPDAVSEIYDLLMAARRECGERVGELTLEVFSDYLCSRMDQLRTTLGADAIDFVVGVDGGEVKFTAGRGKDER